MKSVFRRIFGNISIVLGIVFIVFIILDWYNAYMNFIGNSVSIKLLIGLSVVSIINGIAIQVGKKDN